MPQNFGKTYMIERVGILPSWLLDPGYLLFRTDVHGTQGEWDEMNHLHSVPITLEVASLSIASVSAPEIALAHQATMFHGVLTKVARPWLLKAPVLVILFMFHWIQSLVTKTMSAWPNSLHRPAIAFHLLPVKPMG